jgi:hypothetical protein
VVRLCNDGHVLMTRCFAALTVSLLRTAPHHPQETTASTLAGTCTHLPSMSNSRPPTAPSWKTIV